MSDKLISVRNVSVKRNGRIVVDSANFNINKGDFIGMVGPNGGGKTTLIEAILGLIPIENGSVQILGQPLEKFNDWNKITYLAQDSTNFDKNFPLTVKELISLGRLGRNKIGKRLNEVDRNKIEKSIQFMELKDIQDKRIGELSGGQKQRVFVAKALVRDPQIMFLDEPVTGVDPTTREKFYEKLAELNQTKDITIVNVSHDLSTVFCRMSKVICVNKQINVAEITDELDTEKLLSDTYGDHSHFIFHKSNCEGEKH